MRQFLKTKPEIIQWLYNMEIENYIINDDLSVDVDRDVNLNNNDSDELKFIPVQFGIVNGNFTLFGHSLTSLKGCPFKVTGYFDCSYNHLTSLKFCPKEIGNNFFCTGNLIKSLKDGPEIVHGKFKCYGNPIENLNGFTTKLYDNFEHDINCLDDAISGLKNFYLSVDNADYDLQNYKLDLTPQQIASIQMQQELHSELENNSINIKKNKV